jgi:ferredoxin
MHVDDVAVDFPELKIVLAHPSFPWQDEALAVAVHKPQVYIDLSGWSPKYFPEILIQYTNTRLKTKMLFGSDFPLITPDRWLADFEQAEFKDEVRPLILRENAIRLPETPMKIVVDNDVCSSNGECTFAAPTVFRLDDGKLNFDPTPDESDRSAVEDAVLACPTQAITVADE